MDTNTTDNKQSRLTSITLYDSIFKDKLSYINCSHHTYFNGDNGSGKTSILNLIPVFYGCEPGRVVTRQAGKLKFNEYYLPNPRSVIVFEYMRFGVSCCAVLYTVNGRITYRFLKGTSQELFTKESVEYLKKSSASVWLQDQVSANFETTNAILTTQDYQAVLFNHRSRLRGRDASVKRLNVYASEYSLCSGRDEIRHLGALTSVMLQENNMLESLKVMLLDSYVADHVSIEMPKVQRDEQQVQNLKAFARIEQQRAELSLALEQKETLNLRLSRIKSLYRHGNDRLGQYEKQILANKQEIEAKDSEKEKLDADFNVRLSDIQQQKTQAEISHDGYKRQVKILLDEKVRYENENLEDKVAEYANLEMYREQLEEKQKFYDLLSAKNKSILKKIEEETATETLGIQKKHDKAKSRIEQDIARQKEEINRLNLEEQTALRRFDSENLQRGYEIKSEQAEENSIFNTLTQKVDLQLAALVPDEEDRHRLDATEQQIVAVSALISDHSKKQLELNDSLHALEKEIARSGRDIETLYKKKAELSLKKEEITNAITPVKGSLQALLEKDLPQWKRNIGMVIRPELLARRDLDPVVLDQKEKQDFYGIEIDLSAIETPEYLQEKDELQLKLAEINDEIGRYEAHIETAGKELNKKREEQEELQKKLIVEQENIAQYHRDLAGYKSQQKEISDEIAIRLADRKKSLEAQKANLQRDHKKAQKEFDERKKALKEYVKDSHFKLTGDYSRKRAVCESSLEVLEQNLTDENDSFNKQLKLIEKVKAGKLKASGIDSGEISKAKADLDKASDRYSEVRAYSSEVKAYQEWLREKWSGYDALKSKLQTLTLDLDRINADLQKVTSEHLAAVSEIQKATKALRERNSKLSAGIESIKSAMGDDLVRSAIGLTENIKASEQEHNEAYSTANLCTKLKTLAAEASKITETLTQKISSIVNVIDGFELKTQIATSWNEVKKHHFKFEIHNVTLRSFELLECLKQLFAMLGAEKQAAIEAIRTTAISYQNFYERLNIFTKAVNAVASNFKDKLEKNPFPAISRIDIKLVSKISEFELYKELRSFVDSYSRWQQEKKSQDELPDESLIEILDTVTRSLVRSDIKNSMYSLAELHTEIVENGRLHVITNDNDLRNFSSYGLSKLARILIFCSLTRSLCTDFNVAVHWPLDEIGEFYNVNIIRLFELMDGYNISLCCAQPNPTSALLNYFESKNMVVNGVGIKQYVNPFVLNDDNPLLDGKKATIGDPEQALV